MRFLLTIIYCCLFLPMLAQSQKRPHPTTLLKRLNALTSMNEPEKLKAETDQLWSELVSNGHVPFIMGDSVTFLYKGKAQSVSWQGDFNGWGRDTTFPNLGQRVGKSDLWQLKAKFPQDARLDYKIVLDGKDWLLDPANPHQQWGGNGPNSELRLPDWKPNRNTEKRSVKAGQLLDQQRLNSKSLGYEVNYKVYVPANYAQLAKLPVIYVTDGHEYGDDKLGAMPTILDNLIATKKIRPILAVFIDPRQPNNSAMNRRMTEFALHEPYLQFVTQELIPIIDKTFQTAASANARAILGTSLGGLNAAFFGAKGADYFHLVGIHSPAFWFRPAIYQLYENSTKLPLKIYMSTGVINDTQTEAHRMKAILEAKGYPLLYKEVNEGHSWGNWRNLIDDVLIYFFQ